MAAYYNEIDPYAAEWLRNLIKAGHIADGVVDERSIADVVASDLDGFTQCHFFAGIGVWSLALRRAGWPDDRPVWTGSCPCQPFSAAGKGTAFADERHLWPAFHHLIEQCRLAIVLGEQVASKDADPWLDLVSADLEALGFAVGAVAFPAAGVGAPHIRDRTYWVAHAGGSGFDQQCGVTGKQEGEGQRRDQSHDSRLLGRMGNADYAGLEGLGGRHKTESRHGQGAAGSVAEAGELGRMVDAQGAGLSHRREGTVQSIASEIDRGLSARPSPTNGYWRDADWLYCRDGKWRAVEPGTFPLVNGASARVGRLRAYGNAIVAAQAQIFIEVAMESLNAKP